MFNSKLFSFLLIVITFGNCGKPELDYKVETNLNPNNISPLTAQLIIKSKQACRATVKVLGDIPVEQSFTEQSQDLEIQVVGLYPNRTNKVLLTLDYEGGQIVDTIRIKTDPMPNYCATVEVSKVDRAKMEPGFHLVDMHYAQGNKFHSVPFVFDDKGVIRWYLDLSYFDEIIWPIQRVKNGNILVAGKNEIHEYDMLGKQLKKYVLHQKYKIHHDIQELPNGDLLMAVDRNDVTMQLEGKQVKSRNDFIMLYSRATSKVLKLWDLAKHLDVSREDLNMTSKNDWIHVNGVVFDARDSSIVISSKNQGVIKVGWDDQLKWIMAPHKNWGKSGRNEDGFETAPYLLTAVDQSGKAFGKDVQNGTVSPANFDFPWGQHAPAFLPNGNLILYDNGYKRNYVAQANYSRAVEYQINDQNKTFQQVWQYGKERGQTFFSLLISDVDYLPKTKNILVTSGFVYKFGKIVEVQYSSGNEVFEATVNFKTLKGTGEFKWGELDIMYRSERFELVDNQ